jgi:signal transduction histidine kinase
VGCLEANHSKAETLAGKRQPWHGNQVILSDESKFLKGLFDGIRCGVLAVDRAGHLILMNELASNILEVDTVPPAGTPIESALAGHPQIARVMRDCFRMACLPNRAELVLGPDGQPGKTIGFTVSLVAGDGGRPDGAAMFFKDLTRIEQRAERERLRDRLAALGQMAASLAHEIRNPLASIEVTCSLLGRRLGDDSEGGRMVQKIVAEVRRLNRTITSSLEFVRPVSLSVAPADLHPMLEEAITVAVERRGRPEVEIRRRFDGALSRIPMDRGQLRQVFENLVLNALEAVGDRGVITVETERVEPLPTHPIEESEADEDTEDGVDAGALAVVRVTDSGPGISDEERQNVFHPFFTTKENGSGVGLSMARKIVDCHGGLIDVDDAPDGGARFSVRLPTG